MSQFNSYMPNDNVIIKTEIEDNITRITVIPFVCHLCKKAFTQLIHLEEHLETHIQDPSTIAPYDCLSDDFVDQNPLQDGGIFEFECHVCCQGFENEMVLSEHYLEHELNNPYSCDMCDKRFKTKYHLKQHYVCHTGIKPFSCKVCGKCFRKKDYLQVRVVIC